MLCCSTGCFAQHVDGKHGSADGSLGSSLNWVCSQIALQLAEVYKRSRCCATILTGGSAGCHRPWRGRDGQQQDGEAESWSKSAAAAREAAESGSGAWPGALAAESRLCVHQVIVEHQLIRLECAGGIHEILRQWDQYPTHAVHCIISYHRATRFPESIHPTGCFPSLCRRQFSGILSDHCHRSHLCLAQCCLPLGYRRAVVVLPRRKLSCVRAVWRQGSTGHSRLSGQLGQLGRGWVVGRGRR